jgi:hypothetical protein
VLTFNYPAQRGFFTRPGHQTKQVTLTISWIAEFNLKDDVKTLMFIAETRQYNTAKLLHRIDRISVMDRQGTQ